MKKQSSSILQWVLQTWRVINEHFVEGDVVWIHDYHLMFLPKCLKMYSRSMKDEDMYKFFNPDLPPESTIMARAEMLRPAKVAVLMFAANKSGDEAYCSKGLRHSATLVWQPTAYDETSPQDGSSVPDVSSENSFSCAVSRKRSAARYRLGSADNVVSFLKELTRSSKPFIILIHDMKLDVSDKFF